MFQAEAATMNTNAKKAMVVVVGSVITSGNPRKIRMITAQIPSCHGDLRDGGSPAASPNAAVEPPRLAGEPSAFVAADAVAAVPGAPGIWFSRVKGLPCG